MISIYQKTAVITTAETLQRYMWLLHSYSYLQTEINITWKASSAAKMRANTAWTNFCEGELERFLNYFKKGQQTFATWKINHLKICIHFWLCISVQKKIIPISLKFPFVTNYVYLQFLEVLKTAGRFMFASTSLSLKLI